jgi:hypothetical protein
MAGCWCWNIADDAKDKKLIGEAWAEHGGDYYLFLMAVDQKTDDQGRNERTQIMDIITQKRGLIDQFSDAENSTGAIYAFEQA